MKLNARLYYHHLLNCVLYSICCFLKSINFLMPETEVHVVIYHSRCLHVRIAYHRTEKPEPQFLQVFAYSSGKFRFSRDFSNTGKVVYYGTVIGISPDEIAERAVF